MPPSQGVIGPDLGDLASIIAAFITAVGILLAYLELRHNTRVQRAQFLLDATERYFGDSDLRRLYYDIDYGKLRLHFVNGAPATVQRGKEQSKPFIGSEEARLLDSLLYTFDVIGRIVELGALDNRQATIFAFQAVRVFKNPDVEAYLNWIDKERTRFGGEVPAHQAARKLLERTKLK